ncbi:MAG: sigma-70 family RNA polymerase sigma factor [Desulfomonile tiedjei]|nr:sigma-70 family RNA polymerase sigma factor [Desulfomonile tiedjei]
MSNPEHEWPQRLAPKSIDREASLGELRVFLLKGVRSGLSGRPRTDEQFIEDVVQTALVRILDSLDRFEGRSAFTTWALAIALRVAYSELRRRHWNNVSLEELREKRGFLPDEVDTSANPFEAIAFNSLIALMHRLVRTKLTERQRNVLLAELNEMPQDEIARQMSITRNAVYKLSHDARKALRRALEAAGYEVEQVRDVLESPTR